MSRMIFVNLPVEDLGRSRGFLEALGATNEPKFTDDTAACMQFSDSIFVMLLTHDKFRKFTPRPIADANSGSQVLLACRPMIAKASTRRSNGLWRRAALLIPRRNRTMG